MKKIFLLLAFFFSFGCNAVSSKNILEAIFRKISNVHEDTEETLAKVCNIKNNAIDILSNVNNLSVTECQVSGLDDLSDQVSILGEELSSEIENIQVTATCSGIEELEQLVSTNDQIIISSIDNISLSGIDNLESQISLLGEELCSKIDNIQVTAICSGVEELEQLVSTNDQLIISSIDNISVSGIDGIEDQISVLDDTLCSKLESIITTATLIDQTTRTIDSKIDELDIDLESSTDLLCNKSILTQSAVEALANAQGFVSVFGENIISPLEDMINVQFQYGISSMQTMTSLTSTGTVFTEDSMAVVSTGAASDGEASIQSKRSLRYRPGHEGYAFFTALFEANAANSTQWIGIFDESDGIAIGYNGTTFSILFRRDGDADTTIAQSSFNRDPLDGTGPSGFTIDTTKLNVFRISYGWLGAAPITFQVLRQDGVWITFHIIERPNSENEPSLINPILPIQAEVKNSGNTSNLQLKSASWNAGIAGSESTAGHRYFSTDVIPASTIPTSETHMMTIRNKSIFQGKLNKIEIRIAATGGGPIPTAGQDSMILRLRKNATVSGTSFVDIDTSDSVVEVSTAGTYSAGTGQGVFSLPSNNQGGPLILFFDPTNYTIILLPGESMTITGEAIQNGADDTIATISWEERF